MGSKKNTSFRIPTETFNGDCVQGIIMSVVYSIPRRSSDWTVLDVWPACPLTLIRMTKDEKVLAFFKGLLLLNVLSVKKLKKISNPPLVSYLSNEPNFWLKAFLYDFDNIKKDTKKQG
jgi:hypothetical protein